LLIASPEEVREMARLALPVISEQEAKKFPVRETTHYTPAFTGTGPDDLICANCHRTLIKGGNAPHIKIETVIKCVCGTYSTTIEE
jgi:hypothetical protein